MRAIESPFSGQAIEYRPGSIVTRVLEKNPLSCLSRGKLSLWSFEEDRICDEGAAVLAVSKELFVSIEDVHLDVPTVCAKQFSGFVTQIRNLLNAQKQSKFEFNFNLSYSRCKKSRIPIDSRTIRACLLSQRLPCLSVEARASGVFSKDVSACWYDLVRSVPDRADQMVDVIRRFVFVLPKVISLGPQLIVANPNRTEIGSRERLCHEMTPMFEQAIRPFYAAHIRQRIFFPDRKLVQFDSGKLQTLCELLHRLKREGHKCLIFTQMSKMLDILEVFLNLHAHTYVRLDGSTGIDKRQKLMDRFNSDPKLFCFILSTRSGGLGINLTGADTVIFYDSDWNPAMDAQVGN